MPSVYQIIEWDIHFENNKSRVIDIKSWTAVPNKQHGMGLMHILTHHDGAALYGVWCLIIGACSQQRKPRHGWLTDDGKPSGRPWSIKALATRWRRPEKEIAAALQILCSEEVAWMNHVECPPSALQVPPERRQKEGRKEGLDGGIAQAAPAFCSEPEIPASEPQVTTAGAERRGTDKPRPKPRGGVGAEENAGADTESPAKPLITYPVVGRGAKTWNLTEGCLADLSIAFPDVDVMAESRKALAWIQANSSRRKTSVGMRRFLTGWMMRTNDRRGGSAAGGGSVRADELDPADAAMIEERARERSLSR